MRINLRHHLKRKLYPGLALAGLLALAACGTAPLNAPSSPAQAPARAPAPVANAAPRAEAGVPALPAANSGRGGYYQDDGPGDNPPPNLADVPDAEVRNDPLLPRSNRPYVVFGKTYTPVVGNVPFTQVGIGSWYGKKFHGQRTSSGEIYDMYKMTAAHPTLPIPSYARLTNLVTGAQVVVRINDRGPFHANRAIDVSYTAALKLGLLGKGSHELQIDRILPDEVDRMLAGGGGLSSSKPARLPSQSRSPALSLTPSRSLGQALVLAPKPVGGASASPDIEALMLGDRAPPEQGAVSAETLAATTGGAVAKTGFYLQLGAYARAENAEVARARLAGVAGAPDGLEVVHAGPVYRLFCGPYANRQDALQAAQTLPNGMGLKPIVIQR